MGVRVVAAGAALLVTSIVWSGTSAASVSSQKTTKDGVYTKAQAERAAPQYAKICANCHDPARVPDGKKPGPLLVGDAFLERWNDKMLGELMTLIRLTMPNDGSATITTDEAVDLTAYILQANKFPEGKEELKNDEAGKKIVILK